MEKEDRRYQRTRQAIHDAMWQLIREKDFSQISVGEIAQRANINRVTFYRHYEIPRDVLTEIQRDFYKEMKQQTNMPKSPEETGRILGLTPEEVVRAEAQALLKLRQQKETSEV